MKYLYIILMSLPVGLFGQISIEPNVNLTYVWLSVENSPEPMDIRIENDKGRQHGLGLTINAKLFDNFIVSAQTQYSQINSSGKYEDLNFNGNGGCNFGSTINRWDNAVYFSYSIFKNLSFGLGAHAIFQPSIFGNFFGRGSQPYGATEFGFGFNAKYLVKKITISLNYYQGLENRGGNFYYFDPINTLGLKVGYPIDLKLK